MQIEEESLPQAWRRLLQLLNALPDHPLKKYEILDIFYNGLTDASKDHLDSCAGCVFRERIVDQAELLLKTTEENFKKHNISLDGAYEYDVDCYLEGFKNKSCWHDNIIIDGVYDISGIEGRVDLISGCDYMIEESGSSNNFNQTLTTQGTIVEFKVVNELKINHICQTLLYAFMTNQTHGILYNIKTGEMLHVSCDNEELFMKLILDNSIEDN